MQQMPYQLQCTWCPCAELLPSPKLSCISTISIKDSQLYFYRRILIKKKRRKRKGQDKKILSPLFLILNTLISVCLLFINITSSCQLWYGAILTKPSANSFFLETGASFWHGRARKEIEFDEWTFNEFMNTEKSMKGNQVSLIVKPDLHQSQKPIF